MSDPAPTEPAAKLPDDGAADARKPLPRFRPARLRRELGLDAVLRRVTFVTLVAIVLLATLGFGGQLFGLFAGVCVIGAWLGFGFLNARAATGARALLPLVQQRPALFRESEAALEELLERRGLLGWVRLTIYQAWATIRHAQGRHAEAAELCASVLQRPLGPAEPARADLSLMMVESLLEVDQPAAAWPGLVALAGMELSLDQTLQRLFLQTRYEVAVGRPAAAATNLHAKVALAELLPAGPCGRLHALLAEAAEAAGRPDQAAWLRRRAAALGEAPAAPVEGEREKGREGESQTERSGYAAARS